MRMLTEQDPVIKNDGSLEKLGDLGGESYTLPAATAETLGGVKVGSGLSVEEDGTLSGESYTLPAATAETLGGVKVGSGLSVTEDGTLSTSGGGGASIVPVEAVSGDETLATVEYNGSFRVGNALIIDVLLKGTGETIPQYKNIVKFPGINVVYGPIFIKETKTNLNGSGSPDYYNNARFRNEAGSEPTSEITTACIANQGSYSSYTGYIHYQGIVPIIESY